MSEDVKRVYQIGSMGTCCWWCRKYKTCDKKYHPLSKAPCVRCDEFEKGAKNEQQTEG